MPILESLIGPITSIIDKIIPDKEVRARAKLELLQLEGTQELQAIEARMTAIVAEANSADPWTSRARSSFLYVMYVMILWRCRWVFSPRSNRQWRRILRPV